MINKVVLIGHMGADAETRTTTSGSVVANLRIATSDREKDKSGQWQDVTEWHRVVCFGKTAEFARDYLRKGRQVYVEGKIKTNKWQDKQGQDRYTTEIVAFVVKGLGPKDDSAAPRQGGYTPPPAPSIDDTDIPF